MKVKVVYPPNESYYFFFFYNGDINSSLFCKGSNFIEYLDIYHHKSKEGCFEEFSTRYGSSPYNETLTKIVKEGKEKSKPKRIK